MATSSVNHPPRNILGTYWLIGFSTALVACVRCHGHHGLDFRTASHDAANSHQLANLLRFDIADRQRLLCAWCLEVDLTEITILGGASLLSTQVGFVGVGRDGHLDRVFHKVQRAFLLCQDI